MPSFLLATLSFQMLILVILSMAFSEVNVPLGLIPDLEKNPICHTFHFLRNYHPSGFSHWLIHSPATQEVLSASCMDGTGKLKMN